MGWAKHYIDILKTGKSVSFRPHGHSMTGKVNSGQLVFINPIGDTVLKKDDIVLCKVNGSEYLHIIKGLKKDQFLIGNNKGGINGWTGKNNIFGILVKVEF